MINDPRFAERAEIIREKGTNRNQFFRGQVDKYSWVDIGSSYLPGELVAAFLWAQMEEAEDITQRRLAVWNAYHEAFAEIERKGLVRRPIAPDECQHNAHMYYLLLPDGAIRDHVMGSFKAGGVNAIFHYIPLHSSPAGLRYGRAHSDLPVTDSVASCILRLPMWIGLTDEQIGTVTDILVQELGA